LLRQVEADLIGATLVVRAGYDAKTAAEAVLTTLHTTHSNAHAGHAGPWQVSSGLRGQKR
jgi:predicted Zn-dependent protease